MNMRDGKYFLVKEDGQYIRIVDEMFMLTSKKAWATRFTRDDARDVVVRRGRGKVVRLKQSIKG